MAYANDALRGPKSAAPSNILYVTSEMADFVKVGGLGDVSAALPRALQSHSDARVLIPGYRVVLSQHPNMRIVGKLPSLAGLPSCKLGQLQLPDGLKVYVVLCSELYDREGSPYGDGAGVDWPDNDLRFARLGLAAAELAGGADPSWRPDLLHLNDWTSALAPAFVHWRGLHVPTILTIHNLAYQGLFGAERVNILGIPERAFQIEGVEFYGKLSFLKAGIFYASHVTTVSATYAQEITTPKLGCGLDGLLRIRSAQGRLTGILNGIDETWGASQTSTDASIADRDKKRRSNAERIRKAFGLAVSRGPLFAVVSRLVHQKGIDLTIQAAETLLREGGQLIATGRGEAHLENALQRLATRHPGSVGVRIGFEQSEADLMYSGSDFLLMPSRFEPCGLSQMYAQSVGTIPVAARTGGLADTVVDGQTGFLFKEDSLSDLLGGLYRAIDVYAAPRKLKKMRKAAMGRRFGWNQSAQQYGSVYQRALSEAAA
jgi:starch synthase